MNNSLKPLLEIVANGVSLSVDDAESAFDIIMSGEATESQIGAFLMALRVRGETVEEITGAVRSMRAKSNKIKAPEGAIDIVGTGGDGAHTLNISTASAIVVAGCGVPVAKHGNKAASSKSGSSDVLDALGVNLDADFSLIEQAIDQAGIGFLMAQRHHPAMRFVGPSRAELGTRSIFNLLGPLTNPATVRRQFTGVFAREWIEPMAQVLKTLGSEACWVVHGADGLDELSTVTSSWVAQLKDGEITTFEVSPDEAGLPFATAEDLRGDDPSYNAAEILKLLDGVPGAFREVVLYNAAAALLVAGNVTNLKDGVGMAAQAIDSGKSKSSLEQLVKITNSRS